MLLNAWKKVWEVPLMNLWMGTTMDVSLLMSLSGDNQASGFSSFRPPTCTSKALLFCSNAAHCQTTIQINAGPPFQNFHFFLSIFSSLYAQICATPSSHITYKTFFSKYNFLYKQTWWGIDPLPQGASASICFGPQEHMNQVDIGCWSSQSIVCGNWIWLGKSCWLL